MKNLIFLFLLTLVVITNSCKDKSNGFQPSLDLDEYVLMKVNSTERLFTPENQINVRKIVQADGEKSINISLTPVPLSFTHFHIKIDEPMLGDFKKDQLEINYLDYSFTDEYPMINLSCRPWGCDGEINLTIHEIGTGGEKIMGEISGTINSDAGEPSSFTGEFVVYLDE